LRRSAGRHVTCAGDDAVHAVTLERERVDTDGVALGARHGQQAGLHALGAAPVNTRHRTGETHTGLVWAGAEARVAAGAGFRHVDRAVVHGDLPRVVQVVGDHGHGAGLFALVPTALPAVVVAPVVVAVISVVVVLTVAAIGVAVVVVPAVPAGRRD